MSPFVKASGQTFVAVATFASSWHDSLCVMGTRPGRIVLGHLVLELYTYSKTDRRQSMDVTAYTRFQRLQAYSRP